MMHNPSKALNQSREITNILVLGDRDLSDEVVDLLSNALKSTHFQKFALRENNFG